jgi:dipeptidyl aminopeptidase/acylaminoacyl peptidase
MRMRLLVFVLALLAPLTGFAGRPLTVADFAAFRDVSDPHLSPDGAWVLYSVKQADLEEDKSHTHLWMTSYDGSESLQLTFGKGSESTPKWSADGSKIAFLSSRGSDDDHTEIWVMSRRGGEAQKVGSFKSDVEDYAWSPDGKRMAVIAQDPDPLEPAEENGKKTKTKPPIVVDRFQFKQDRVGYLTTRRQHLYLLDLQSQKSDLVIPGTFDEELPAWSPDGSHIAFVSKRTGELDRADNYDLYSVEAKPGSTPLQLTTHPGDDNNPGRGSALAWSPDGKSIAYVQGAPPELIAYGVHHLAIVPATGGTPKVLTASLDRNPSEPHWSPDGSTITFLVEDDRSVRLDRIDVASGKITAVAGGQRTVLTYDMAGERTVLLSSDDRHPAELFVGDQQLTHHNDALMAQLDLGAVQPLDYKSKDGTLVHGFVVTPPHYESGKRYPAILRIHGGPVSQFSHRFSFEWQILAANGYVVVAANPRGSSGRGQDYSRAIWADWGNKDAQDVLGAVDAIVGRGLADPARLGVGGWSYGGMLTNYVIARDQRFKAATSGASISNILAGYGTDQYIRDYEIELGRPWEHPDVWSKISFPFLHADRIATPTLFLAGDKDFNVPLLNSEQMYQALRSLGRPTQLVIYPGQFHGISKPSYVKDRYERYLAWYAKYLK